MNVVELVGETEDLNVFVAVVLSDSDVSVNITLSDVRVSDDDCIYATLHSLVDRLTAPLVSDSEL